MEPISDSRVDAISDSRFDPNIDPRFPMALLLEIARERSLENLLEKIVRAAAALPATTRYEIWLIEKGDSCLNLAAAANHPLEGIGGVKTRLADSTVRIPLGEGVIGKTAVTGQQTVLRDLYKEPGEFSRLDWLTRELVRGFAATAISFKGEVMGVITTFARESARGSAGLEPDYGRSCRRRHRQRPRLRGNRAIEGATGNGERLLAGGGGGSQGLREPRRPMRILAAHRQPD
jgi:hypothetical protein